ncbi:MAG: M4 family metallopeptidase [Bacteroidales bacterium]|jgi:Zn-dependent metalloprotease|nr:M4 family metallopeptidase [Bacteroidales bacterium]
MKTVLLSLLLAMPQIMFAQTSKSEQYAELKRNAESIRLQENSALPSSIRFRDNYRTTPQKAIEYSKSFFVGSNADFNLKNTQKSKGNKELYRYEQTIAGYPVEFTAWNVHVKNGSVISMNGDIVDAPNFDVVFSIPEKEALQAALNYIGAEIYMWQDEDEDKTLKLIKNDENATYYPTGIKVITPAKPNLNKNKLRTAYKFNIFSKKPYSRKMVYVDAQTGEILFDLSLIHFSDEVGVAHTQYSGEQEITTELNGEVYRLRDNTRGNGIHTLNINDSYYTYAATDFTDDDNDWNNVNAQQDEYATDAHFATTVTYDYYYNIHDRNSIDGNGYMLLSYVHFNLVEAYGFQNNINAAWTGDYMIYGDGGMHYSGNLITPLTTVDICGHEVTHGLTSNTANLVYEYESGALNEGFSDIFGSAIEFYATPDSADWLIGEDIGYVMRSMQNPNGYFLPDTYHGTYWVYGNQDYGGVHTNSAVLSYWFYLLCEGGTGTNDHGNAYNVTPIGMEKAEQIAFKMLTEYLSPTSQFYDAYYYAIEATNELFGACSPETKSVGDAFYAVGVIDEPFVNAVSIGFTASETEFCNAPAEVTFTNTTTNGVNYLWNFGDGSSSTDISPVHVYDELGVYSVTLTVDGGECGTATLTKENHIVVDDALPCLVIMPANGTTTFEGCKGTIYDSGGPNNSYSGSSNSQLIIHAPGAAGIVLEIEEFDIEADWGCDWDYIEFYDGNSISSPLINNTRYCNSNGNPGTVSSTGEYITVHFVSDYSKNYDGYKINIDCINNATPEAEFSVNTDNSCNGRIEFNDESVNKPLSWEWDFGDGNTSTEQNPVHWYAENGVYTVSLTVENEMGESAVEKENLITVAMSEAPEIGEIEACSDTEFEIFLDFEGKAYWFSSRSVDEDSWPVHVGNTWRHLPIDEVTTYYVRELFENEEDEALNCVSYPAEVVLIPKTCLDAISENRFENIDIVPNPSTGVFKITGLENGVSYQYSVTDILGKIIVVAEPVSETGKIDLTALPNGIYFIQIESKNSKTARKIIKN